MEQSTTSVDALSAGRRIKLKPRKLPAAIVQAALVLAIVGFAGVVASNVIANAARLNLHMGFNFLSAPAGFDIAQKPIAYPEDATYLRAFLVALCNTIILAGVAIVFATVLGFAIAMARISSNPLLSGLARGYVEVVRNVPLLLQLFFWYFSVISILPTPRQSLNFFGVVFLSNRGLAIPSPVEQPSLGAFLTATVAVVVAACLFFFWARRHRIRLGRTSRRLWLAGAACLVIPLLVIAVTGCPISWDIPHLAGFNMRGGLEVLPELVAMAIGLTVYGSAFIAELVRGGFAGVNPGQLDAGRALGLSRWQIYSKIVLPQALRFILPPLSGQYIHLLKNSSLASAIGYPDLMLIFAGTALNQTGQPLEIMAMTMASYLFLGLGIAGFGNVLNRRLQLVDR